MKITQVSTEQFAGIKNKSIDFENIDMSALLASFNISLDDLTAISEMFENPDFDLAAMLENCDYSCLDAVVLDLSEVVGSVDIDFDSLDINLKGYDLSEIRLSDVIDILRNSEFVMTAANALLKVGYIIVFFLKFLPFFV